MFRRLRAPVAMVLAIAGSCLPCIVGHAEDSYLFQRDGFRIHYTGNGGNCNGCEWIAIDGDLPSDAGELFQQFVTKNGFTGTQLSISFNSNGGSLAGGIRLGRVIRNLGMSTEIGKSVPDGNWYKTTKGVCFSACAYAFLGGVSRLAESEEYGVHQFFTEALLKDPTGKVFSPVDFSVQQTITGLLLSYVIEMGVSADVVVEANKTSPTGMNLLTKKQLLDYHVVFDPKRYGDWKLEAYRKGLIAYSRSQDEKNQLSIACIGQGRMELLVSYSGVSATDRDQFKAAFNQIEKFALLKQEIRRSSIVLDDKSSELRLRVPLSPNSIDDLENDKDPYGSFSVHLDEPRSHYGYVFETISLAGLAASVRLAKRNCIN